MTRKSFAPPLALAAALLSACAKPPVVVPVKPAGPSFEQKMSWIVRLEDERSLRDPAPPPPADPVPAPAPVKRDGGRPVVAAPPPPPPQPPDLTRLATDAEARVRRRAALAIGRVGLADGVDALVALLADEDPEVRQMAAFGLGLIGDARAADALAALLADPSPLVKGSAAEALGLIGATGHANAIGEMAAAIVQSSVLEPPPSEEDDARRDTPAAAFRLAMTSLVRLQAYEPLASAVLDSAGRPRVRWWPVAFALQRLEDPRAVPALLALSQEAHPYTRAFAAKGLGAMGSARNPEVVPTLLALLEGGDRSVAIEAARSLARLGDGSAVPLLVRLIHTGTTDPQLRLEAVAALGALRGEGAFEALLDVLADPQPPVRAAALRGLAAVDREGFVTVLAGLDPDPHWSVRAATAEVLGRLPLENALPRLQGMLEDTDQRVIPAVVRALVALKADEAAKIALERLTAEDVVVRAASAEAVGALKPANGASALSDAYRLGLRDQTYVARAAALAALARYGASTPMVTDVLTEALADRDWAVRVRAAALLRELDPALDVNARIRPAPLRQPREFYESSAVLTPPVSTQAYIETDRGLIHIEMAMLDAPLTVDNFIRLARAGFFDGVTFHRVVPDFVAQAGDPRGDGEGGPGYTIRDEINQRPYLRGTIGMALDWEDTGGSQFFITHSPQPHLDTRYTVLGRVLSGMEVVDQLQPWDVIRRVRVWDGTTLR